MTTAPEGPQAGRKAASVDFVRAAWRIQLKPAPKAVLIALADCVEAKSRLAWPSVETISSMTGWARSSVQRALRELVAAGIIAARGKTYGGRGNSTRWELQFGADFGESKVPLADRKGVTATPFEDAEAEKGVTGTPFTPVGEQERVSHRPERVSETPRLIKDPPETQTHQRTRTRAREVESAAPTGTTSQPHAVGELAREFLLGLLAESGRLPPGHDHLLDELKAELEQRRSPRTKSEPSPE